MSTGSTVNIASERLDHRDSHHVPPPGMMVDHVRILIFAPFSLICAETCGY